MMHFSDFDLVDVRVSSAGNVPESETVLQLQKMELKIENLKSEMKRPLGKAGVGDEVVMPLKLKKIEMGPLGNRLLMLANVAHQAQRPESL
jgi:hypothetical protein